MGKIDNFIINLDKPKPVYFSGEVISGSMTISITERIKIISVSASFIGYCRAHWYNKVIYLKSINIDLDKKLD